MWRGFEPPTMPDALGSVWVNARQISAIRSYLSTAAKHVRQLFDVLVMLAEGRPWQPLTPQRRDQLQGKKVVRPSQPGRPELMRHY
jgi:hypothetical protein